MTRKALLGLHGGRELKRSYYSRFEKVGYSVDLVNTPEEMLDFARREEYDRYFMDLNLGDSNSPDITPVINVYEVVKERVESGKAKFAGISGNNEAVKSARQRGIPVFDVIFHNLADFLE